MKNLGKILIPYMLVTLSLSLIGKFAYDDTFQDMESVSWAGKAAYWMGVSAMALIILIPVALKMGGGKDI